MATGTALSRETGRNLAREEHTWGAPRYRPVVDILETGEELRVVAELPGVRADDIDINFDKGLLTIHGKVEPRQAADSTYVLREYGVGDFYRAFEISETIDASRISAEYADGVLVLHLPKSEKAKARKIEVRAR